MRNKTMKIISLGKVKEEYVPQMSYERLLKKYPHLATDEVHTWRSKTGIELIHQEPDLKELHRIWKNWQLMPDKMKVESDKKSFELFGMNNKDHYANLVEEMSKQTIKKV